MTPEEQAQVSNDARLLISEIERLKLIIFEVRQALLCIEATLEKARTPRP